MTHSSDMDDPNEQGRPFWQCEQCGEIVDDAPMSNAKHTPGPWMHNATKGRNDAVAIWAADDSIAVCTTDFPKHFAESVPPPDICDANARLIAAAPDLLEACKGHGFNLFALLNRLVNDGRLDETERDLVVDHIVFARAAIAKATA